tara:strand:+ start:685 stop:1092 length:408 start_codon:yes stop_codon:yes gene_type:complete
MSGSVSVNGNDISNGATPIDGTVSNAKLAAEFNTTSSLTAGASVDVDCSTAQVFSLTPNQNTALNITNPRVGSTKLIVVTGAAGGYSLSWTVGGSSGTFNLVAGTYNDTLSTKNFIQLTCVAPTEFWYTISQIAS